MLSFSPTLYLTSCMSSFLSLPSLGFMIHHYKHCFILQCLCPSFPPFYSPGKISTTVKFCNSHTSSHLHTPKQLDLVGKFINHDNCSNLKWDLKAKQQSHYISFITLLFLSFLLSLSTNFQHLFSCPHSQLMLISLRKEEPLKKQKQKQKTTC